LGEYAGSTSGSSKDAISASSQTFGIVGVNGATLAPTVFVGGTDTGGTLPPAAALAIKIKTLTHRPAAGLLMGGCGRGHLPSLL